MTRGDIYAGVSNSGGRQEVYSQKAEIRRPSGRPRLNLDCAHVVALRDGAGLSWRAIAKQLRAGATTVRRAYRDAKRSGGAAGQNPERSCTATDGSTEEESA